MRLLAALALVAAVVAVAVVVTNSLGGKDGDGGKKKKEPEIVGCKPEFENAVENGFYIVQQDDLLSLIAQRTCVARRRADPAESRRRSAGARAGAVHQPGGEGLRAERHLTSP